MTATLVFPAPMLTDLRAGLLSRRDVETVATVLAWTSGDQRGRIRLLPAEIIWAEEDDYQERSPLAATLKPVALARITARARTSGMSLILCHSHPVAEGAPAFSPTDYNGEREVASFLASRIPRVPHAALVIGPDGLAARILGCGEPIRVAELGLNLAFVSLPDETALDEIHHRQILAFGESGQRVIGSLRVGVVGAGGTGSVVIPQLAHAGVREFVVIDPDVVERTNLNRLLNCGPGDIGRPKVEMAERTIRMISPNAEVMAVCGNVLDLTTSRFLTDCDLVFCCPDSQGSRLVLNRLAYQHFIPVIDMGSEIICHDGAVEQIAGRVRLLSPGLGCLVCSNALDWLAVSKDLRGEAHRAAGVYGADETVPQPSVMPLNSVAASLAVGMFLSVVTGLPMRARYQLYDAVRGVVRDAIPAREEKCVCCQSHFGLGSSVPLPFRQP